MGKAKKKTIKKSKVQVVEIHIYIHQDSGGLGGEKPKYQRYDPIYPRGYYTSEMKLK